MNTLKFETVQFSTLHINPGIYYIVIFQLYEIGGMTLVNKKLPVTAKIKKI